MFNYKDFAHNMAKQAEELVPEEFSEEEKKYLINTLENFTQLSGEALVNETSPEFSNEQIQFISQIIAEWTFHKVVDVIRSDIPKKYYDSVLQKIAFTAFEVAKQGIINKHNQEELLKIVEYHVQKCYAERIEELFKQKIIDTETKNNARRQSNIDKLALEIARIEPPEKDYYTDIKINPIKKFLKDNKCVNGIKGFCGKYKFTTIATIIWISLLIKLYLHGVIDLTGLGIRFVILCVVISIVFYITWKISIHRQLKQLENVRQQMQDLVNPDKMYERLGVDVISMLVGINLLPIADPDLEGELLAKIAAMRQRLTDELGFIIPNIRITDSTKLDNNEYNILIRNNIAGEGFVYSEKYMVIAEQWDKFNSQIPENSIVGVDPTYEAQVYWIEEANIHNDQITAVSADDVIIKHLEETLIKNVDEILTIKDVYKYIALIKTGHSSEIVEMLLELLSVADIRRVFVNLIREQVSIKDICYIFERMYDYARFTNNPVAISERIRVALSRQICSKYADENKVIYAIDLSEQWEKLLNEAVQETELGRMFMLTPKQISTLTENTAATLLRAKKICEHSQVVILSSPGIRLPLYQLLVRHLPTVNVLSYSELSTEFKVENMGTIDLS